MKLVVIESPYGSDDLSVVQFNVTYARRCIAHSIFKGEAPIASHLLYTQDGILDDNNPEQRRRGIEAGHAWMHVCDLVAVYADHGITDGMWQGIEFAKAFGVAVRFRKIEDWR